jgi:hypothetical protein
VFDLISDVLPFGRLWYGDANAVANAIGYAEHYSRSHHAVIRVYDSSSHLFGCGLRLLAPVTIRLMI